MKQRLCALILFLGLVSGMSKSVYAMNYDLSDAAITADSGGLIVEKVGNDPGYFVNQDGLYPGDSIKRSYIITNEHKKTYYLYLRAEKPVSEPLSLDLVNKIQLKLTLNEKLIYDGVVGGGKDEHGKTMENNIYLGGIEKGSRSVLTAEFLVPGSVLDNEYQSSSASVEWVFVATTVAPGYPPVEVPEHTVRPTKPVNPTPNETTTAESMTEPDPSYDHDDGEQTKTDLQPNDDIPRTGDFVSVARTLMLFVLSGVVIGLLWIKHKKSNSE